MAKKVVLSSPFEPQCAEGSTEMHYGIPFTAEATEHEDEKGRTILCLTAELDDKTAAVMVEAGRVEILADLTPAPKEAAKPAAPAADAKK